MGSKLRLVNFMRHIDRRAAFFSEAFRDEAHLHFGNIVFEIGVRECCQLVNPSLRSDWDAYPHSFLLYHDMSIQVHNLTALHELVLLAPCMSPQCKHVASIAIHRQVQTCHCAILLALLLLLQGASCAAKHAKA